MEWRCEWCGKPHEKDDPPCDNCGHGKFEKAVVRQTDLSDGETEPSLVWVCTACGREHPKNSPPCSRCGNADLEKQRQQIDDTELSTPSYYELLTLRYALAAGAVLLFAVVFALGATGVVDLPGFGPPEAPTVDGNVPGNGTHAGSVPLGRVESEFTETLNGRLAEDGVRQANRVETLDKIAQFSNEVNVYTRYENPSYSIPEKKLSRSRTLLTKACSARRKTNANSVFLDPTETSGKSASELGKTLITQLDTTVLAGKQFGIDTHQTPDGGLSAVVVSC